MRFFLSFALLVLAGCGRPEPGATFEVRWPRADRALALEWRRAVFRWEIVAGGHVFRGAGPGLPESLEGRLGPDATVRVALWLADARRPPTAGATLAGEGTARRPVELRLLDHRWALQAPTMR